MNFKPGPQGSWENHFSRNAVSLEWKGQREPNRKRLLEPQNPNGMKQSDKTTRLQTYITLYEKERMTQSRTKSLEGKAFSYRGLVLEPKHNPEKSTISPAGFQKCGGPVSPIYSSFSLLWPRISIPPILACPTVGSVRAARFRECMHGEEPG